jgi:iron-sulfur cluster protein
VQLEQVLTDKKLKEDRRAFEISYSNYIRRRNEVLKNIDVNELKEKLMKIRESSIEKLIELKNLTIKNFEQQGIAVHEARNAREAREILFSLIEKGEVVVKSKTNVGREIELNKFFKENKNEVFETDTGDFLVSVCEEEAIHPITPAIHITTERIVEAIERKFGVKLREDPKEIVQWIRNYIRERIFRAKVGITGANVISAEGAIFVAENEGNISLISRIPEKHIVVSSIDKIVESNEEAIIICKALAIFGTASSNVAYVSVIGGPSSTADIQKEIVYGAQGAREVHLILVDNGRSKLLNSSLREALYCIGCGACLYSCPVYRTLLKNYGGKTYYGGIGLVRSSSFEDIIEISKKAFYCTTCSACKEICPVRIDVPKLIRELRADLTKNNINTEVNKKIAENLESFGNPYGVIEKGSKPKNLYCC